jgi:hypothetical protein
VVPDKHWVVIRNGYIQVYPETSTTYVGLGVQKEVQQRFHTEVLTLLDANGREGMYYRRKKIQQQLFHSANHEHNILWLVRKAVANHVCQPCHVYFPTCRMKQRHSHPSCCRENSHLGHSLKSVSKFRSWLNVTQITYTLHQDVQTRYHKISF